MMKIKKFNTSKTNIFLNFLFLKLLNKLIRFRYRNMKKILLGGIILEWGGGGINLLNSFIFVMIFYEFILAFLTFTILCRCGKLFLFKNHLITNNKSKSKSEVFSLWMLLSCSVSFTGWQSCILTYNNHFIGIHSLQ